MDIRRAALSDSASISKLVSRLTRKYIAHEFSQSGTAALLESMQPEAIEKYLQSGYEYHVAEIEGLLVGVAGMRDNSHLYHLFVDEEYQKRGIAGQLWKVAMESCLLKGNPGVFTVNSSIYARPVYEKLGFAVQSEPRERNGVISIPMKLTIVNQR